LPKASKPPESIVSAKEALARSALSLFVQNGIDGTSIRDIAGGTEFTNAALFKHYDSKEALALSLFESCYDALARTVAAPLPDAKFPEQMRMVISRYVDVIERDLDAALYVQENLRRYWTKLPANPARVSLLAHLRGVILLGRDQGYVDADKDPRLLVATIIGMLGQFARMLYFKEFQLPASDHAPHLVRLAIDVCRKR
jgi:AcrR family transcriptional regulator